MGRWLSSELQRLVPVSAGLGGYGDDRYGEMGYFGVSQWCNDPIWGYPSALPGIYEIPHLFLSLGADSLSASNGAPVDATVDFPDTEADRGFALLLSLTGTGPTEIGGLSIPLSSD